MQSKRLTVIRNGSVVTEQGVLEQGEVLLEDGIIRKIGEAGSLAEESAKDGVTLVDADGGWVLPGFIDVHVHGGYGSDFMDASTDAIDTITRFHGRNGTTGLLATTMTASKEAIENVLVAAEAYRGEPSGEGAALLGVHLEGPFISPKWPGAQNPAFIVAPQQAWLEEWTAKHPELIKTVTLAPESEGAFGFIEWLTANGIVATCGHTDASYDVIKEAVGHGLRHAVHTFNAMTGLHHRNPGTVGAVLTEPSISAEVIADGLHVHPACIRLLAEMKKDNLVLITDAMSAAGLGDGDYSLGGLDVVVKDGAARLKEGNSLAGSTLTMIRAFRFVIQEVGFDVAQASRAASGNPARLLGIDGKTGSLAEGKQADVLVVSKDLDLQRVWVQGRELGLDA